MGLMEGWKIINFWHMQLEEAGRNHPLQFLAVYEDTITVNDAAKRRELRCQRGMVLSD